MWKGLRYSKSGSRGQYNATGGWMEIALRLGGRKHHEWDKSFPPQHCFVSPKLMLESLRLEM